MKIFLSLIFSDDLFCSAEGHVHMIVDILLHCKSELYWLLFSILGNIFFYLSFERWTVTFSLIYAC